MNSNNLKPPYDIIGRKFNYLTVLDFVGTKRIGKHTISVYNCKCDCGNEIHATRNELLYNRRKSCGCMNPSKFKDLTGMKFERLTVISQAETRISPSGSRDILWNCKCECGNEKVVSGHALRQGKIVSCGCYNKERITTHGYSKTRLYGVWLGMKTRCYNKNDSHYEDYGARGIKMCDEWKNDFMAFREWAYSHGYDENAPKGVCTIDRINFNGDYCPENCRFVSSEIQAINRRSTYDITENDDSYGTKFISAADIAKEKGIPLATLYSRIYRGWSDDKIFDPTNHRERLLTCYGKTQSISQWGRELNIPSSTILDRLKRGCSPEEALAQNIQRIEYITYQGITASLNEWNTAMGLPPKTVYNRIRRNIEPEKAITLPMKGLVNGMFEIGEDGKPHVLPGMEYESRNDENK